MDCLNDLLLHLKTDKSPSTKNKILNIATKLFIKKSFVATSMDEIAKSCNIKKSSIYRHFNSKKEIGIACLEKLNKYCDEHFFSLSHKIMELSNKDFEAFILEIEKFHLSSQNYSCLPVFITAGSEKNSDFSKVIFDYYLSWFQLIQIILSKLENNDASTNAERTITIIVGSLFMRCFDKKFDFLKSTFDDLYKLMKVNINQQFNVKQQGADHVNSK